jgi:hypothetical protein
MERLKLFYCYCRGWTNLVQFLSQKMWRQNPEGNDVLFFYKIGFRMKKRWYSIFIWWCLLPASAYFQFAPTLLRPTTMDAPKQDGCCATHIFKARPLNKKVIEKLVHILCSKGYGLMVAIAKCEPAYRWMQIFSSKGEMGVFRNSKREITVPMVTHRWLQSPYMYWITY